MDKIVDFLQENKRKKYVLYIIYKNCQIYVCLFFYLWYDSTSEKNLQIAQNPIFFCCLNYLLQNRMFQLFIDVWRLNHTTS